MAYQSTKPAAADQLSVSQADIQGNFSAINTFVSKDHYGFGTANAGGHFFTVGAAPAVGDGTHVGIYAAIRDGNPELYINKAASQIPFTASLKSSTGWTYLPSGIIMKWGISSVNGSSTGTITFPAGASIPAFTAAPTVNVSLITSGTSTIFIPSSAATNFTVTNNSSSAKNFYYLAVGY